MGPVPLIIAAPLDSGALAPPYLKTEPESKAAAGFDGDMLGMQFGGVAAAAPRGPPRETRFSPPATGRRCGANTPFPALLITFSHDLDQNVPRNFWHVGKVYSYERARQVGENG